MRDITYLYIVVVRKNELYMLCLVPKKCLIDNHCGCGDDNDNGKTDAAA